MRVAKELKPVGITETGPGVYLVDFGETLPAGSKRVYGAAGGRPWSSSSTKCLKPTAPGYLQNSTWHTRGRYQTELLILGGDGEETFEPRFTYHGSGICRFGDLTISRPRKILRRNASIPICSAQGISVVPWIN